MGANYSGIKVNRTYLIIHHGRDRGDFGSWRDAVSEV